VTIDLDALVAPIELAETPAEARSATWAALRMVKDADAWDWPLHDGSGTARRRPDA
jgi:hypothetical protein